MHPPAHFAHEDYIKEKLRSSDRQFDISKYEHGPSTANVEVTLPNKSWTFVGCPPSESENSMYFDPVVTVVHTDAIVIGVKGQCRRPKGTPVSNRKAAVGVYIHHGNEYNDAFTISEEEPRTVEYATSMAALRALEIAQGIKKRNPTAEELEILKRNPKFFPEPIHKLSHVVIKTDCRNLVQNLTHMAKWRAKALIPGNPQGNHTVKQQRQQIIMEIDETVNELNKLGVQVDFWSVKKNRTKESKVLAKAVLNNVSPADAMAKLAKRKDAENRKSVGQVPNHGGEVPNHSGQLLNYGGQLLGYGDQNSGVQMPNYGRQLVYYGDENGGVSVPRSGGTKLAYGYT
jgi:hypothetical protein